MPTYDLQCTECDKHFEVFVMRMLRNDDLVCPQCGSTQIRRGIGGGVLKSESRSDRSPASSCGSASFG